MINSIIPEDRRNIAIIGGTGDVGKHITREFLKHKELNVKIISRKGSSKKELLDEFKSNGALIASIDYTNYIEIKEALDNIDVVISAIGDNYLDAQKLFIKVAASCNVKLFIPSEFFVDLDSDDPSLISRLEVRKELQNSNLGYILYYNGLFMEYLFTQAFGIDLKEAKVEVIGKGETEIDLITITDVASFIAQTYYRPEVVNQKVNIVGEITTISKALNDIAEVTKRPFDVKYISLEEVDKLLSNEALDSNTRIYLSGKKMIDQGCLKFHSSSNYLLPDFNFTSVKEYTKSYLNQI